MGNKIDAVFEGGGVRGIGLVGAAAVVTERGYEFENVAGTSAGAIVASLIAAGYSAQELVKIMNELHYDRLADKTLLDQLPGVGPLANVVLENGIYKGKYFEDWLKEHLAAKGARTFGDLVMKDYANEPRYRYRLQVVASDVSTGQMLLLPQDAGELGMKPDELEVAHAVRMSMSIPFFYEPVKATGRNGDGRVIVDGGILSNFPVWIFDDQTADPPWPTFGFRLVDGQVDGNRIDGPISFLVAIAKTMLYAHDARYIKDADFVRTIAIPAGEVAFTDFGITAEQRDRLYQSGRKAAEAFLSEWDFGRYKARFRQGDAIGRGTRLRTA